MIDLRGSLFTDITPENLASQMETQAFAYALGRQIVKLCEYADRIRVYASVGSIPERILDALAVELRTPAYSEDLPLDTKQELVRGTLAFYARLGTPEAVNWVIRTLFGNGSIEEWFSYGGTPHHFRVSAVNDGTFNTLEGLAGFMRTVSSVKRLSSWLDEIQVETDMGEQTVRIGGQASIITRLPIPEIRKVSLFAATICVGVAMGSSTTLAMQEIPDQVEFTREIHAGGALAGVHTSITMPEIRDEIEMTHIGRAGICTMSIFTTVPVPEIPY